LPVGEKARSLPESTIEANAIKATFLGCAAARICATMAEYDSVSHQVTVMPCADITKTAG